MPTPSQRAYYLQQRAFYQRQGGGETRQGFWENRSEDYTGPEYGLAEGAASWTEVNPARAVRGKSGEMLERAAALSATLHNNRKQPGQPKAKQGFPPPQMPPGLPKRGPGGGGFPMPRQQIPTGGAGGNVARNHFPTVLDDRPALGTGRPALNPGTPALGTGQATIGARQNGEPRTLMGQNHVDPTVRRGAIDATARSVPNDYAKAKAAVEGGGSYMDAMYGGDKTDEDVANDEWADTARKRIAFTTDPKNKIPVPDPRLSGTGRYQDQVDKHNAAYSKAAAKTGFSIPSLYA